MSIVKVLWIIHILFVTTASIMAQQYPVKELVASLQNPNALQLHDAIQLAKRFPVEVLDDVVINNSPLLHHLFNLYMMIQHNEIRRVLMEIVQLCAARGVNTNPQHTKDPDILFKSIFIREISVANKVALKASNAQITAAALSRLYMLLADPVPVAKMLLMLDTRIRNAPKGDVFSFGNLVALKKLIAGATLPASSKFAVKGVEYLTWSEHFNHMLPTLGDPSKASVILLSDTIRIIEEMIRSSINTPLRLIPLNSSEVVDNQVRTIRTTTSLV